MRGVAVQSLITTLLDALGLLLVAAGLAAAAWTVIGPAALLVAGVVVLCGSWWATVGTARVAARRLARAIEHDGADAR